MTVRSTREGAWVACVLVISCAGGAPQGALPSESARARIVSSLVESERAAWGRFLESGDKLVGVATGRRDVQSLIDLAHRLDQNRAEAERSFGSLPPRIAERVNALRARIRIALSDIIEKADSSSRIAAHQSPTPLPTPRDRTLPGGFDGLRDGALSVRESGTFVFRWPLHNPVVGVPFGYRRDPIDQDRLGFHDGVDMHAQLGDPVLATAPGVVKGVGVRGGGGLVVIIEHARGYRSLYLHLARAFVSVGEHVSGGSLIALAGNSGRSTGPHLHFVVQRNGKAIDPVSVMGLRVDRVIE